MAVFTFASIYIGSHEVTLKICEMGGKKEMKTIDLIRQRLDLGHDVYAHEPIDYERVDLLCEILNEYRKIMDSYRVDDFRACSGPVLKNASNYMFVLDQVNQRTGINVDFLSNSELRFMGYEYATSKPEFEKMIGESAAFVNVGGGELQITLFVKDKVLTTQHLVIGSMRLVQQLKGSDINRDNYKKQIKEMAEKELETFKSRYLFDRTVKYVILTGDYTVELMRKIEKNPDNTTVNAGKFITATDKLVKKSDEEIAESLNLSDENDLLLLPSLVLYREIVKGLMAESIWVPGIDTNDGIAYDYALNYKFLKAKHDFELDVISASRSLANRYMSYSPHLDALVEMSGLIFDALKKIHGMGKREKLLLTVSAILHDCGKYVSFAYAPDMAYNIIMVSEIMGLSHRERVMVANIIKYNTHALPDPESVRATLDSEAYIIVSKCAAILRVANAMDRSHKQKYKNVKVSLKDRTLLITIETAEKMTLEKTLFMSKTSMFEDVFSIKAVLKEKPIYHE